VDLVDWGDVGKTVVIMITFSLCVVFIYKKATEIEKGES
jgi:hypothetical protein